MVKRLFIAFLMSLTVLSSCSSGTSSELDTINDPTKPLKVGVTRNMPGYFIIGGESYGYPYEILSAYANSKEKNIKLSTGISERAITNTLEGHQSDVIITLSSNVQGKNVIAHPLYATNYVVLSSTRKAAQYKAMNSLAEMFDSSLAMVSADFEKTASYDMLLDSLPTSSILYVSHEEVFPLASALTAGEFDLLICERSEALLAEGLLQNISRVYEFEESVQVSLAFNSANQALYDDFSKWAAEYRKTRDYASLNSIYLQRGFATQFATINKPNRVVGGISVWDDLVKDVGEKEGVDWRLLSAIAYNESRFRPNAVSRSGAQGMMQIMPIAARQFGMENQDLTDPRTSLTIASKLLKSIDSMLDFAEDTPDQDRLSIILAAYNGGIGNIMDARRLAMIHDENRDSWEAVSKYLVLMGDRDFNPGEDISYRNFRGSGETIAYVDKVLRKYDSYRTVIAED